MQMYGMSGESLGVIGKESGDSSSKLPAWKQDFLSKPSASVRRGIAWVSRYYTLSITSYWRLDTLTDISEKGFKPPYEDTDTLVLTAPSGEFVDIRFPKDTRSIADTSKHPSFWAFSGRAETTFHDATDGMHAVAMPYTAHCKFLHDIDSRGPGISDEGDMFILTNGDCLEMGVMLNPATGKDELYKEYWCSASAVPRSDDVDDSTTCVVAKVTESASVKGIMIRLGGNVQGIMSIRKEDGSESIEVERWVRGKPQHTVDEDFLREWSKDIRSNGSLPCSWLCMSVKQVGQKLEYNDTIWEVTEFQM
ncbi:hypothetical protein LTS08_005424 [Lithohypha guttulata]|uniref:uncharacterized protein n=1 Tax=Lithohypha guttulata TaxID=1690604 RepID=UPI002DDF0C10|nr:hypothetical protein LTR51_003397 [Lithohypha guttulata]KAK5099709.1 hypothetical protein LTS08_005424 [Lithohypha guttulata]